MVGETIDWSLCGAVSVLTAAVSLLGTDRGCSGGIAVIGRVAGRGGTIIECRPSSISRLSMEVAEWEEVPRNAGRSTATRSAMQTARMRARDNSSSSPLQKRGRVRCGNPASAFLASLEQDAPGPVSMKILDPDFQSFWRRWGK